MLVYALSRNQKSDDQTLIGASNCPKKCGMGVKKRASLSILPVVSLSNPIEKTDKEAKNGQLHPLIGRHNAKSSAPLPLLWTQQRQHSLCNPQTQDSGYQDRFHPSTQDEMSLVQNDLDAAARRYR